VGLLAAGIKREACSSPHFFDAPLGAIFRPAAKRLLSVSWPACLVVSEVRTKTVTTVAGKSHPKMASSGRAENGLVKASYRLPFFALFFFVDFLAVFFLAAIKWLLRVRCPIRPFVARFGTPDCEASGWLHYQLRRIALCSNRLLDCDDCLDQ
jgi:hypothetical protein